MRLFLLALCAASAPAFALEAPHFALPEGVDHLPLKDTHASVEISGVIARVQVTQVYVNEGTVPIHARYVFPGSTRAAIHALRMTVGKRTITAEIARKEDARKRYEQAREDGKTASLLEQHRPNVFEIQVANILPQDTITVDLEYSELLTPEDGVYEFVYPAVVGPRFTGEGAPERWTGAPLTTTAPYRYDVAVRVVAGMPVEEVTSPSHRVGVVPSATGMEVVLDGGEVNPGNRDFILRYRLRGNAIRSGILQHTGKDENHFLLMVQPPERIASDDIPPREYIFVLDVSGSMHGMPIDTTKQVMRTLLPGLRAVDTFNVLLFESGTRVFAPSSVQATAFNVEQAVKFIDNERGGGGTHLLHALTDAFRLPGTPGAARSVIIVTDGYIHVETDVFHAIRKAEANVFAFGIGSSVNRHLIEGMARAGGGEAFVVTGSNEVKSVVDRFTRYIRTPALTEISLHAEGVELMDVEPRRIPDLFAERPIVVSGKYRGTGRIQVTGRIGDERFEQAVEVRDGAVQHAALPILWARTRVAELADLEDLSHDEKRKEEVIQLGLRYHLLTQYTSLVAVDDRKRAIGGSGVTVDQPAPLAEGVSNSFGGLSGSGMGGGGYGIGGYGSGVGGLARRSEVKVKAKSLGVLGSVRAAPAAEVDGTLDSGAVMRVIKRRHAAMQRCYADALGRDPALKGRMTVELVIAPDGRVKAVTIEEDGLNDAPMKACLVRVLQRLRFPSSEGEQTLRYPLVFAPAR